MSIDKTYSSMNVSIYYINLKVSVYLSQYLNYQQQLKVLYDTEKEIDEHNKELLACHSKVVKAKKQVCLYYVGICNKCCFILVGSSCKERRRITYCGT